MTNFLEDEYYRLQRFYVMAIFMASNPTIVIWIQYFGNWLLMTIMMTNKGDEMAERYYSQLDRWMTRWYEVMSTFTIADCRMLPNWSTVCTTITMVSTIIQATNNIEDYSHSTRLLAATTLRWSFCVVFFPCSAFWTIYLWVLWPPKKFEKLIKVPSRIISA